MFELNIKKSDLLPALTAISGAVDKRQSLPILANILLRSEENKLHLTATDLEVEMSACLHRDLTVKGQITIPAKKLIEIIRSLEEEQIALEADSQAATVISGRSRFKLSVLPADQFPVGDMTQSELSGLFSREALIQLFQTTHFAVAQQEHRAYLNSLLFELNGETVTTVATDGHRMAVCRAAVDFNSPFQQYLLPRRSVLEMLKMLNTLENDTWQLTASKGNFGINSNDFTFTTKLIEARFPHYRKAIPSEHDKFILIDRDVLKRALSRIAILANEKTRAVVFHLHNGMLSLIAKNHEQDEATELLDAQVDGQDVKICFNANYLLECLQHLPEGLVRLSMTTTERSILVESVQNEHYQYIMMPLKV